MSTFKQCYMQLPGSFYHAVKAEVMVGAKLIHVNRALQQSIGLRAGDATILSWLSGEQGLPGCESVAQKYTGHQFGYYNPNLGDGRGLLLGQFRAGEGSASSQWLDFHLKGAGTTPYSRGGDGRAVLRSTLREYLGSEALYGLGVPTTRALALATSEDRVRREGWEARGTLIRVTPSHIRFGHFEWAFTQGKPTFDALLNQVLAWYFPECLQVENPAFALLMEICRRTARLVAHWQAVGFNHGVMNTDNMSILGETFDFGPFGFFDDFEVGYICNHSDDSGRYAFNEQPKMGLWNCQILGQTFQHYLTPAQIDEAMEAYVITYNQCYLQNMMAKLGCKTSQPDDKFLVRDLLLKLDQQRVDFSLFFRRLAKLNEVDEQNLWDLFSQPKLMYDWVVAYTARLAVETEVKQCILATNPAVYLRNFIAQEIIEQVAQGQFEVLDFWLPKLQSPYQDYPELAAYQQPPKKAQKNQILSCSS